MQYKKHILRSIAVTPSPRVQQVLGMFDVPAQNISTQEWDINFQLPAKWNIGVIVGPSGCGKSTIARELFHDEIVNQFPWPNDHSILDGFPKELTIRQIVGLLSSVGFSSPPAWVRPFAALSNGQQFRVQLARTLAEAMIDNQPKLIDEYSSVVDRTVARIGSAAVAKTVRQHNLQFIAVTCHYDILDWLDPDWIYEPHTARLIKPETRNPKSESMTNAQMPNGRTNEDAKSSFGHSSFGFDSEFGFRNSDLSTSSDRESLQRTARRPPIEMEIIRTDRSAWKLFKPHHYLSGNLNPAAACFVAKVENEPAAFTAVLPFPHPTKPGWREHRTVCLPDFQGVGIGNAMSEFIASLYKSKGKPYTSTTSHPAMIRHRAKSPLWRMSRVPGLTGGRGKKFNLMRKTAAIDRLTAGFEYIGPARCAEANCFGLKIDSSRLIRPTSPTREQT